MSACGSRDRAGALVLAGVLVLVAAVGGADAQPRQPLKVGVAAVSAADAGLLTAVEAGLFEPLGLAVELAFLGSGTEAVQSLLSGQLPVSTTSAPPVIHAVLSGARLVLVAELFGRMPYTLVAAPGVTTPGALRGKRAGVSRFGSAADFAMRFALRRLGLEPDRDVTVLQVGGQATRLAALRAGSIDATVVTQPSRLIAAQLGLRELVDLSAMDLAFPYECLVVWPEWLEAQPDAARALIDGIVRGTHRFKTRRDEGMAVLRKYLKVDDPEVLAATYATYARLLPAAPLVGRAGLRMVLDEIGARDPRARAVRPEDLVRDRLVRELEEGGVIRRLYEGDP